MPKTSPQPGCQRRSRVEIKRRISVVDQSGLVIEDLAIDGSAGWIVLEDDQCIVAVQVRAN